MTRGRPAYELYEHTADTGIVLEAPTLPLLFERAAAAMFDLIVDIERVGEDGETETVELEEEDADLLLVSWLGELLGRAMERRRVYGRFDVRLDGVTRLRGRIWGEALDPERHRYKTEIKAVTYHDLALRRTARGFQARVVFDL
ncbi:MAG: archease [Acidobacteria bacterium]|nr:MAG: archease [Acidobacteriota bacterium]